MKRILVQFGILFSVAAAGWLFSLQAQALSGVPARFDCPEQGIDFGFYTQYVCTIKGHGYTPPGAAVPHPVSFLVPKENDRLKMKVKLGEYQDAPDNCTSPEGFERGALVIKPCPGHYPKLSDWDMLGWYGFFQGDSNARRITLAIDEAWLRWKPRIDLMAGVALEGTGYGGTGAILQSMMIERPIWGIALTTVHAQIPHTLFSVNRPQDPLVLRAWKGADPWRTNFQWMAAVGALDHIYYRVNGSPADSEVNFDLDFFRLCDKYVIACFGTWHGQGHTIEEPGVVLPYRKLFNGDNQDVRLNTMMVVFTNSTANHWGDRGHYNLGLSWHGGGYFIDSEERVVVPVRYLPHKGISDSVPDMPDNTTVDITVRGVAAFDTSVGRDLAWEFGDQSGETTVTEEGEISVTGLTIPGGEKYKGLIITPVALPPAALPTGIVYTRIPRRMEPFGEWADQSNAQLVSDIGLVHSQFTKSDIVFKPEGLPERVAHQCTGRVDFHCAAMEPRVSPSGRYISYAVAYAHDVYVHNTLGAELFAGTYKSEIWIYDVAEDVATKVPHQPDAINRMPDWLSEDELVFMSTCGNLTEGNCAPYWPMKDMFSLHRGAYPDGRPRWGGAAPYGVGQAYGYQGGKALQLWRMNFDGKNARNLTPHEQMALRPTVTTDGWIVFSSWNAQEDKAFYDLRPSANPGTNVNKYWIDVVDANGADQTTIMGGHKGLPIPKLLLMPEGTNGGQYEEELLGLRACEEVSLRVFWCTVYYRSNHHGNGVLVQVTVPDFRVEGCYTENCYSVTALNRPGSTRPGSGAFMRSNLKVVTPFGTSQDTDTGTLYNAKKQPLGKAGFPFRLPEGRIGITRCRGFCFRPLTPVHADLLNAGEPLADRGIYEVLKWPVTDPFDETQLKPLIDDPLMHEWDAQWVGPEVVPELPPALNPNDNCYLQVVDATKAELRPMKPYSWPVVENLTTAYQGSGVDPDDPEFHANNMKKLAIHGVQLWDEMYPSTKFKESSNYHGHKSKYLLGAAPLQADGSVKAQVPCDTPLQMSGLDDQNRVIAHDSKLHSLRPGETRTCHGCHDGHSEERRAQIDGSAEERFAKTLAAKAPIPYLNDPYKVTFKDVAPILETKCGSCHEGYKDDGLLWSRIAADWEQMDFPWIDKVVVKPTDPAKKYQLPRPYFSFHVNRFCRNSPLCWYAWDSRLDGRTNAALPNDIDFKGPHNAGLTRQERRIISEWIAQGAER